MCYVKSSNPLLRPISSNISQQHKNGGLNYDLKKNHQACLLSSHPSNNNYKNTSIIDHTTTTSNNSTSPIANTNPTTQQRHTTYIIPNHLTSTNSLSSILTGHEDYTNMNTVLQEPAKNQFLNQQQIFDLSLEQLLSPDFFDIEELVLDNQQDLSDPSSSPMATSHSTSKNTFNTELENTKANHTTIKSTAGLEDFTSMKTSSCSEYSFPKSTIIPTSTTTTNPMKNNNQTQHTIVSPPTFIEDSTFVYPKYTIDQQQQQYQLPYSTSKMNTTMTSTNSTYFPLSPSSSSSSSRVNQPVEPFSSPEQACRFPALLSASPLNMNNANITTHFPQYPHFLKIDQVLTPASSSLDNHSIVTSGSISENSQDSSNQRKRKLTDESLSPMKSSNVDHSLSSLNETRKQIKTEEEKTDTDSSSQQVDEKEMVDPVVLKRKKNTEAARRSRQRKNARLESLEDQVHLLETEKSTLALRLAVLENEKANWILREKELHHRVKHLEDQLAESHRAMLSMSHNMS